MNYRIFLTANTLMSFASGLFTPFWIIFVQDIGGSVESFGLAVGLMVLAQSATSYFVGKYSDRFGRKIFMIMAGLAISVIIFCYTLIVSIVQLYFLQIIFGIVQEIENTTASAFLGDLTEKASRGKHIGKFRAVAGIFAALAMMVGGFIVGKSNINIIFYIVAGFFFLSAAIMFFIREDAKSFVL